MIRRALLLTAMMSAACSAQPQATPNGMTDEGPAPQTANPAIADQGPQGPQFAGTNNPVPRDAPKDPSIRNVAAATGRANVSVTPPPFTVTPIGKFDAPFAMAFLPGGALLVTEKAGKVKLRRSNGQIADVGGAPAVAASGQGGLLDIAIAPDFAASRAVYLSYAEPRPNGGSALALARATLTDDILICDRPPCPAPPAPTLNGLKVIWRAGSDGPGGQFGANILFSPDGKYLFLSSGERQRFSPAQDPKQTLGKILRLTLDGKAAPGNPGYAKGGVEAMTWSSGHRNPYGMVFTPNGQLWEEEMGPKGGDELNLILPGKNYGWPIVSNGDNYSGQPIPDHPSRPDLEAPKLWWNPVISPGGMALYTGALFPQYRGSLLIAGLSSKALIRVTLSGTTATAADQWDMGSRIRDVAVAPDGSIWVLEDGGRGAEGRLLKLTPKS